MIKKKDIIRYAYTDEIINSLGKFKDSEIAKKFNISKDAVCYKRKVLEIPSFSDFVAGKCKQESYPIGLIDDLGKDFDTNLSKKYDISRYTIIKLRERFKVKGFIPYRQAILNCNYCNKQIKKSYSSIKNRNYCDRNCWNLDRLNNHIHKYSDEDYKNSKEGRFINCNWCNKSFYKPNCIIKDNNFCNRDCYNEWFKINFVGKKNPNFVDKIKFICEYCGDEFGRKPSYSCKSILKFCSKECHNKWISKNWVGSDNPYWTGYRLYYDMSRKDWISVSDKVRKLDGNRCKICKCMSDVFKHDVHHMLPYRISKDNSLDNLITLCKSCHQGIEKYYSNKLEDRPLYWEKINLARFC